jgi:Ctr copper transporter family
LKTHLTLTQQTNRPLSPTTIIPVQVVAGDLTLEHRIPLDPNVQTIERFLHWRMIPSVLVHNLHSTWNNVVHFYQDYNEVNNSTSLSTMEMDEFCSTKNMAMTMFMDGFHFSLLGNSKSNSMSNVVVGNDNDMDMNSISCLYYFVNTWKLDDSSKFKGAMVFTILLAILVESLSSVRGCILRYYATNMPNNTTSTSRTRYLLRVLCYGTQGLLGYSLMLITMSFSIELVASVIFGLVIGHVLFMSYNDSDTILQGRYNQSSVRMRRSGYRYATTQQRRQQMDPEDGDNLVQHQQSYYYPHSTNLSTPLTMHQTNQSVQSFADNQHILFDDDENDTNDLDETPNRTRLPHTITPSSSMNICKSSQNTS